MTAHISRLYILQVSALVSLVLQCQTNVTSASTPGSPKTTALSSVTTVNASSSLMSSETPPISLTFTKAPLPTTEAPVCSSVQVLVHGSVIYDDGISEGNHAIGVSANYTCNNGFDMAGEGRIVCGDGGNWNGSAPKCHPKDCKYVSVPDHVNVSYDNGSTLYGSNVTYLCVTGYHSNKNMVRICDENGKWTGDEPVCRIKDCGEVQELPNGNVIYINGNTTYGFELSYTCSPGYNLSTNVRRTCQNDTTWSGSEPTCTIKDCGEVQELPNGNVIYINGNTTYGSVLSYTCSPGYNLSTNVRRTCQNNTTWSGSEPTCNIKDCGEVQELPNGNVIYINGNTTYGSELSYTCSPGYNMSTNVRRTCQNDTKWSGSEPTCTIKDCGEVQELPNGNVTYINGNTTYGSVLSYTCSPGYNLSTNVRRTCQNNTTWSGSEPTCNIKDCGEVQELPNGNVIYVNGNTTYGSELSYTCSPGYNLSTNVRRTCQNDTKWSGSEPTCTIKDCGEVQELPNGNVIYINGNTTYGSVLSYTCSPGYNLSTNVRRTCQNNTTWSGSEPTCNIKACQPVAAIQNGNFSYSSVGKEFRSTVTHACHSGYSLNGDTIRTCSENAKWNGTKTTCELIRPELGANEMTLFKDIPNTSSVFVQWKYTYNISDGRTYIIRYHSDNANIKQTDQIIFGRFGMKISNLSSGTRYQFQLFSSKNGILSGENATAHAYTFPLSPKDGGFENRNEKNLTIYWTIDEDRNCENYSIEIDPKPKEPYSATVIVERMKDQSNQSYTFQGLKSGTNYNVQLFSLVDSNKKTSRDDPLTRESFTRPEAISDIREIGKHSNRIDLSLTGPETFREGYIVIVNETGTKHNFSIDQNVTITDLEPGTNYTFNVFSFIKHLTSEYSVTWETMTKPESPGNMEIKEITEDSIAIEWTISDNYTFDNVVIRWGSDGDDLLPAETRNYTIQSLEYGTHYIISIQTVLFSVTSEETTKSTYTRPIPPSSAKVTDQTDSTIALNVNNTEARYDRVVVFYGEMNETVGITEDVISTRLEQGTEYTFEVHSMIGDVISLRSFQINGTTRPGLPPSANIPLESLHEKELTVNWDPVISGGADIYQIELTGASKKQHKNVTASNTSVTFTELEAGRWYTATISTVWNSLFSTNRTTLSIYTRPPAPTASSIDNITTTSMNVNLSETEWNYYLFVVSPSPNNSTYNISKDRLPLSVTGLDKGKQYNISVFSIVGGIQGESSFNVSSYTKPDKVDSTTIEQNVTATTSSVMGVTWDFTDKQGGVDFYSLSFKCTSPNQDEPIQTINYQNRTEVKSAVVENLDPGTFCSLTITTHIGNQTGESVTKDIELSTHEEAPGNVSISHFTTNAKNLSVSWNKTTKPNGIIRRYYVYVIDEKYNCIKHDIQFKCENCKPITPNTNCSGTPVGLRRCDVFVNASFDYQSENNNYTYTTLRNDLHPYRNYSVSITAYTVCFGATESKTEITKQSVPSGPPIDLTQLIPESTYNTIQLCWNRPTEDEQNGIITGYTIYYSYINRTCFDDEGSETNTRFIVNASDVDVKDNTSITVRYAFWSYNVSVSAWTEVGEGPPTSYKSMRTAETTPGEIRNNPLVNDSTTTTFNLYWEPPCYVNGIIDHYRIRVMNVNTSTVVQNFTTNSTKTELIQHLLPYHNYTVSVAAVNTMYPEGQSVNTTAISRTNTGAPHQPTNIRAEPLSSISLKITWTKPDLYTGVTRYDITTKDSVSSKQKSTQSEWNFNLNEFVIGDLEEFWNYTVTVTAITSAGNKTSQQSAQIQTMEAAPGVVTNLSLSTEQNAILPRSIDVTWKEPTTRNLNGILISYFVDFTCTSEDYVKTVIQSVNVSQTTYNLNDIKPSSCNISVYAATAAGNGTIVKQEITVPPGAPIKPQETHSDPLMKESTETSVKDETTQIAVAIPIHFLCDDRNGKPQQIGLIISAADKATDTPCIGDKTCFDKKIKNVYKNWFQVHTQDNPTPYITTPNDWNPCSSGSNGGRQRRAVETTGSFNIGDKGECSGVDINLKCNGQLKPDTSYRVRSFACTEGGCSESEYSKPIKTTPLIPEKATSLPFLRTVTNLELPNCFIERNEDSESNQLVPIVAGVASAAVVLLIVIGAVIFLKRRQAACFAKSAEEGSTHSRTEPGAPGTEMTDQKRPSSKVFRQVPIQLSEFPENVDNMKKDSALIFSDAYKTLRETSAVHPMTVAESQNCRPKNRYTNILPFDHSRVKLLPLDGEEGSDYINASYIPGYTSRREYIATQGPMPATFDDFWRMVWEQNVEIVVMLTKLVEKGRHKCDKYWPNANEPQFYGDLSISVMSESNLSDYTIRIMEVRLNDEKRTVKQFSFLKWPDMGCPEYPELLLEFVKSVRQHESAQSKGMPLVVHCSAGVGRTGTFIAVDHLLQHIRDHDEVDIYALVAEMRNNRCNMVQTEDQYIYIHDCIKEFITSDEDEFDDDDDEHVYANSTNTQQENVYQNTAFSKQF